MEEAKQTTTSATSSPTSNTSSSPNTGDAGSMTVIMLMAGALSVMMFSKKKHN